MKEHSSQGNKLRAVIQSSTLSFMVSQPNNEKINNQNTKKVREVLTYRDAK